MPRARREVRAVLHPLIPSRRAGSLGWPARSPSSSARPISALELATFTIVLLGLAVVVFGAHVRHGGFYYDDWAHASEYRFEGFGGLAVEYWRDVIPGRPALAFLIPVPHALFGLNPGLHLALAAGLGVFASTCFFLFLRAVHIEPIHAAAIAVLSLLFPWSDAVRLWPTASLNNLAICAYFVGTVVALRALRASRRQAILLHGIAATLYLLSVLTYEAAGAAILLSVLLYRPVAGLRRAAAHWAVDLAVVLVPLAASAVVTTRVRHVGSPFERVSDVPPFARGAFSIFASSFLPPSVTSPAAKALVLAAAIVVVALGIALARDPDRVDLRRWLRRGAMALVGVATAYVMFLGSGLYPLYSGVDNRANTFAGFAFAALVYSLIVIVGLLVSERAAAAGAALVAVSTLLVVASFVQQLRTDIGHFSAATRLQMDALARLDRLLPEPSHGSTIYTFGYPAQAAPGVPIFWRPWDLGGAVRLRWNDPSLSAQPVYRTGVVCGQSTVYAREFGTGSASAYGRSLFVDLARGRVEPIDSQSDCQRARRVFRPGPLVS